ncbi:hypothetical protein AWZ03_005921 [Drosophila navojoa]|uniref:Uncharacterized protein n=1 Tax=Drosophila navojoa TaxID=7232 RepID=A0A484BFT5_DRONA|nr:hypothetical protein AWZ03_005921 [Drosophila navojoa]
MKRMARAAPGLCLGQGGQGLRARAASTADAASSSSTRPQRHMCRNLVQPGPQCSTQQQPAASSRSSCENAKNIDFVESAKEV